MEYFRLTPVTGKSCLEVLLFRTKDPLANRHGRSLSTVIPQSKHFFRRQAMHNERVSRLIWQ